MRYPGARRVGAAMPQRQDSLHRVTGALHMDTQAADLPRETHHEAVSGALRDLARLALRAASGAETLESIASRMLETLTALCDAERGAIVLAPHPRAGSSGAGGALRTAVDRARVIAVRNMSGDEARFLHSRGHSALPEAPAAGETTWVA